MIIIADGRGGGGNGDSTRRGTIGQREVCKLAGRGIDGGCGIALSRDSIGNIRCSRGVRNGTCKGTIGNTHCRRCAFLEGQDGSGVLQDNGRDVKVCTRIIYNFHIAVGLYQIAHASIDIIRIYIITIHVSHITDSKFATSRISIEITVNSYLLPFLRRPIARSSIIKSSSAICLIFALCALIRRIADSLQIKGRPLVFDPPCSEDISGIGIQVDALIAVARGELWCNL